MKPKPKTRSNPMPEIVMRFFEWLDTAPILAFFAVWTALAVVGGLIFGGWAKRHESRRPVVRGIDGEEYR